MNTSGICPRKPYAAPTFVRHGDAVEKTRGGFWHKYFEYWGYSYYAPMTPDPGT